MTLKTVPVQPNHISHTRSGGQSKHRYKRYQCDRSDDEEQSPSSDRPNLAPSVAPFVQFSKLARLNAISTATPSRTTQLAHFMNGAAPLLRLVDTAARQSCSRIPHLKAHIHSRQFHRTSSLKRPCRSKTPVGSILTRTRQASTVSGADPSAIAQLFDAQEEEVSRTSRTQQAIQQPDAVHQEFEQGVESTTVNDADNTYGLSVYDIIENGHPDRVLFALVSTAEGQEFIQTASNEAFERALLCLDPDHFIGKYIPIYRHTSASLHIAPRLRVVRSLEDRCDVFRSCLTATLQKRRDAVPDGITLPVYKHVLRCAEVMGDERLAKDTIETDMRADQLTPDLDCYNCLMQACASSYEFEVQQRKHNRQTSYHDRRRHHEPEEHPHNVIRRRSSERSRNYGLREYILTIFKEISDFNLQGDEKTFTAIMRSLAMVRDVPGASSILRSVWNINVDGLMQHDEEEIESPTFYDEDSPLRPSARLLETVVHVYGNNNEVMLGSILCDYISRNYNLPIPKHVWEQQFELTYQFAFRPSAWHVKNRLVEGNIPQQPLERVYDIMTDEPHNIEPRVTTLAMLAMNTIRWRGADIAPKLSYLREAVRLLDLEKTRLSELYDALMVTANSGGEEPPFSDEFLADRQAFIELSLQADADLQLISIAIRRLLVTPLRCDIKSAWNFYLQQLPDLVKEFDTFLPNAFQYSTPTGTVRLENGFFHRQHAIGLADDHFMRKVGLVRQALDLDDHHILAVRLKALPSKVDQLFNSSCSMCRQSGHLVQDCPEVDELLAGRLRIVPRTPAAEEEAPSEVGPGNEASIWEQQNTQEINIWGSTDQSIPGEFHEQETSIRGSQANPSSSNQTHEQEFNIWGSQADQNTLDSNEKCPSGLRSQPPQSIRPPEPGVSSWGSSADDKISIWGPQADNGIQGYRDEHGGPSIWPSPVPGASLSDPPRLVKQSYSPRRAFLAPTRLGLREPTTSLEHVVARQEDEHLRDIQRRWEKAMHYGNYVGTTPDPTVRFGSGSVPPSQYRPAGGMLGVWAEQPPQSGK